MAKRLKAGDKIPAFSYDTPYEPQKSFYGFLQGDKPVVLVFLPNFGHPITRHFITQYLETIYALRSVRLACVVRSRPEAIAKAAPRGSLPFELICDAEGALYDYFQIPQKRGMLRCYSLEGMRIIKQARQEGYSPAKNELNQLPLTLVLNEDGQVLFAHYGHSMTDLPADCSAMERVAQELPLPAKEAEPQPEVSDAFPQEQQPQIFDGFEQPDQRALTEAELLAALEENKAFEAQQAAQGEQSAAAFHRQEEATSVEQPQPAPQVDEPQPEQAWTAAPESSVYPPQEALQEPQEPIEAPQEPVEPVPASVWRGKMIYSPDHVPVKVDFSALGFGGDKN